MDARRFAPTCGAAAALLVLASQTACGSGRDDRGLVGTYPPGVFDPGDAAATAAAALDAYIEQGRMTVKVVVLSCAGSCAEVEAVPTGGNPPYSFAWNDGPTTASRRICPASDTTYTVTVTDSGTAGEFSQGPQTVRASVGADVLDCPDGGSQDAGSPTAMACVSNPSFEGTVASPISASPWVDCAPPFLFDRVASWDGTSTLSTTTDIGPISVPDGRTFLAVFNSGGLGIDAASEPLCAPMRAGVRYSLNVHLASPVASSDGKLSLSPGQLVVYGGSSSCSQSELLWTSPRVGPDWQTFCATLTPTADVTYLSLAVSPTQAGGSYVYVDEIDPVASCP